MKKRDDLIYPELSYKIVGVLFDVWGKIGFGHRESVYQKSVAVGLKNKGLSFKEQLYAPVEYENNKVGKYFFDFLIDNSVVLELKVRNFFSKADIDQVYKYLKTNNLRLGILAHFTKTGVKFKRIVNAS